MKPYWEIASEEATRCLQATTFCPADVGYFFEAEPGGEPLPRPADRRGLDCGAFRDVYSVINTWGANHGAVSCGHIGTGLITLASALRIPAAMHNVPPESVFRPKYWSAFGDAESEGADFRACAALGLPYGKEKRAGGKSVQSELDKATSRNYTEE